MEAICATSLLAGIAVSLLVHWLSKGKLKLQDRNSSGTKSIIAFQEIVEPNIKHVIQVKEQKERGAGIGAPPHPQCEPDLQ